MSIQIRKGERIDLNRVYELVVDLAIYEKEPDAVTATLSDYEAAYDSGLIKIIVAENEEKEIIGMCLGYLTFSTWKGRMMYLEDFVVAESARRLGVGQLLWDGFVALAKHEDCKLLKWQVLDWNEPAVNFYEKNNATIEKNWWNGKLYFS